MEVIQTPHAGPVDLETGDDVEANEPDAHMLDEPGILVREFLCYSAGQPNTTIFLEGFFL
jgi:hypothetical protein